jgi:positive regulator of sigma E activity
MILHPAIIALLASSGLMSFFFLYATYHGIRIIRRWDIHSGSGVQLELERRTYLISTVLAYVFGFQLISLFLFIYTADSLSTLFTGAMCAVGTLNVNGFGHPVLMLKVLNFVLAGLWLIANYTDNRGYDYPLIKIKYTSLLALAPLFLIDTILQARYFLGLHPDVITSCCGSLFSFGGRSALSDIAAFPPGPMKALFSLAMSSTLIASAVFYQRSKGAYLLSVLSATTFLIAIASMLSFIAPYIYELPTHHCPFCLLQKEYGYVGYPLYVTLLCGVVSGMGIGILTPFKTKASLAAVVPAFQSKLALLSFICYAVFTLIMLYRILISNLVI